MVAVLNPPAATEIRDRYAQRDHRDMWACLRDDSDLRVRVLHRLGTSLAPPTGTRPLLFDVGAGSGEFLTLARDNGFDVTGSEIGLQAIELTYQRNGVRLSPLPLAEQPQESFDVVTMWCVVSHVLDPNQFVRDAYAMLRPGGILFIRTPRWCLLDTVGFAAEKASRGRLNLVAERRVSLSHLHLFGDDHLRQLLQGAGFDEVDIERVCHFPLETAAYLGGTSGRATRRLLIGGLDNMIKRNWFPQNTMLAYARKPD